MAMTAAVKDELSRVPVSKLSARRAEVATMLRFAGALHLVGGHIVIEAELDTGSVARRLRKEIADIFGHGSEVQIVAGGGLRKGSRYLVRVTKDGERLARQSGLVDLRGRPVKGLPHHVVAGGVADAEAAWRGAFLAHGSLTEPGRACSLEITCPTAEAALALVGLGSRPRRARFEAAIVWSCATVMRSARCSPASAPTNQCWRGRNGGCAARCVPPPTAWPISTMPTCAARRARPWRPGRGCSGP